MGFPACAKLNRSNATWLTFRRTYASGARQGCAGQGRGAVDGSHQCGCHDQRLHAGAGRFAAHGGGSHRAVNCSRLFTKRKQVGATVHVIAACCTKGQEQGNRSGRHRPRRRRSSIDEGQGLLLHLRGNDATFAVSFATATVSAMRDPAGTRAVEEIDSASAWSASPSCLRASR